MRSFVLFAVLASVAPAAHAADTRESRYGPAPDRPPVALDASSGYAGPVLSWGGKSAPVAAAPVRQPVQPPARQVPARYVPAVQPQQIQQPAQPLYEPWRQLGARPAATPAPQAASAEPALSEPWRRLGATPSAPQAQAPAPVPLAGGPPRALPTSIYQDAPAAPAPRPVAQAVQPVMPAGALPPTMARTYSVGRQYGLQPDGIPPPQPNGMVLIAPSDEPAPSKKEEPMHGSAEWLARGPIDETTDARRDDAKDSAQ